MFAPGGGGGKEHYQIFQLNDPFSLLYSSPNYHYSSHWALVQERLSFATAEEGGEECWYIGGGVGELTQNRSQKYG